MSILVNKAREQIRAAIGKAVGQAIAAGELPEARLPDYTVEAPADRSHGDFAANVAMAAAKLFKTAPRKIAEAIVGHIDLADTYIDKIDIAGPGFINFTLKETFWADIVDDVVARGKDYGRSGYGKSERVMVEFVSANPTGPMHIGNARGGALGDCLAGILEAAGYDVTREFYVNDAGNQIEKFALSLEARYLQIFLGEDKVPFPEDGYHGEDIKENAMAFADENGDQFVKTVSEVRKKALVDFALPRNIEGLQRDLKRYRIEYENWFRESSLYESGELDATIQRMKDKGLCYEKDGALWYKAIEHGGEKDEVLIRSGGFPTYFATDIAYHYNKLEVRKFHKAINVWGADHHGHVARMKGALKALGVDDSRLEIVLMQLVRLMSGGEVQRVSKRTGKSITLSTLLEEVPVDVARFFFNLRDPSSHLEFDLNLAVEQSASNPVYYVQYAHARICSIVKYLKSEGIESRPCTKEELLRLSASAERDLIWKIATLTDEIITAVKSSDPARITRYVHDIATLFHKFYDACRIKGDDEPLMQARLCLAICTRTVIANVLAILKIDAPESM